MYSYYQTISFFYYAIYVNLQTMNVITLFILVIIAVDISAILVLLVGHCMLRCFDLCKYRFVAVSIVMFLIITVLLFFEFQYYTATELEFDYEVDTDIAR